MLDYRIDTFLNLCETMNYTKTARRLFITQPAVTGQIHYLERFYGVKLFDYTGKTLTLTEEGRLLRQYALAARADSLRMKAELSGNNTVKTTLCLGATKTIGAFCMPHIMADYVTAYPNLNLCVHVDNTRHLLKKLEAGEIDFALIEGFFESSRYSNWPIAQVEFLGVCGSGHPLAGKEISFTDLLPYRLLLREEGSGTREITEGILNEQNMRSADFPLRFESGSFALINMLLEKSLGVSFVYRNVVEKQIQRGAVVPIQLINFSASRQFHLVALKNRVFEKDMLSFYEFINQKDYFHM